MVQTNKHNTSSSTSQGSTSQDSASRGSCCGIPGLPHPRFFKAFCDPTRLQIFAYLLEQKTPKTVSEISGNFPIDVSVVSRHLAFLRDEGIVQSEKNGKEVRYSSNNKLISSILKGFASAIEICCPSGSTEK